MEKTIEKIMTEYAIEHNYKSWYTFALIEGVHERDLKIIFDCYASQFQTNTDLITTEICVLRERVAELKGMLQSVVDLQSDNYGNGMKTHLALLIKAKEIESLINKGKDNGN